MLDLVYRYENGFVLVPVVVSCRRGGLFEYLRDGPAPRAQELAVALKANEGHLAVALDMFRSLGWIEEGPDGRLALTSASEAYREIPDAILDLYQVEGEAFLSALTSGPLRTWLDRCGARWRGVSGAMRDYLDGAVLVPLFVALARHDLLDRLESDAPPEGVEATTVDVVRKLFADLGFGRFAAGRFRLTPQGEFLLQRALFHGVPVSYLPMLRQMDTLLFGDAARVFETGADGHERHLDRALNVVASGDQHRIYFAEMQDLIVTYFDGLPLEEQPRCIVDMGCGDGTLLRHLYTGIATRSVRGRHLADHPLLMVGVDSNAAALEETARTLAGIPHLLMTGDIADPARMMADLEARGGVGADGILHVRSFLDHDRVFLHATRPATLARLSWRGRYVDRAGRAIPAAEAVRSLVEHLSRWSGVVCDHGLCVAEVHCLGWDTTRRHLELTNSFHFQALQAFSGQQLVEADVFLLAAAEAGLVADPALSRRYPRTFPLTHITLNWLRRAPFRIRVAETADTPALLALECACWAAPLRASAEELSRRLDASPEGCLVIEYEGDVAGAIYSQRIARVEVLERTRITEIPGLHQPDGPVIQILGLNVRPELQHLGLGDRLLAFFLHLCSVRSGIERVCGITRCRDYPAHPELSFADYIRQQGPDGRPRDPILQFHASHGASIRGAVPGYRIEDSDNHGAGVLIEYRGLHAAPAGAEGASDGLDTAPDPRAVAELVEACIRQVLDGQLDELNPSRPLMELGLDSLQLLELRLLLAERLRVEIAPTVFFEHPTPRALCRWLADRAARRPPAATLRTPATAAADRPRAGAEPSDLTARFAIIGIGCRFPAGADNPEGYWRLLTGGSDAITEMPEDRRELLGLAAGSPATRRRGGYLPRVDRFDAGFFGMPTAEAEALDPQHRLLLELAWESLEDAGIDPTGLAESSTGIFVGLFSHDYELLQVKRGGAAALGAWLPTGNAAAMAAGRLAYFLGLRGPALTLDTACSSSLVAIHLACGSLRSGESDMALALAANLILSPELSEAFERAGMLAADGLCKTFSSDADGYVRSEGGAAVVLKRLDRALADGNRIWAVIRGSAINQDGASNGLTAPNGHAQKEVLRAALAAAGALPEQVSYVELHGTGTPLGDPVEYDALREVYGRGRPASSPLLLGSVKTVIGHTEAAAGLAGLIKVVLSLHHRAIPPHLHLGALNPHIDLATLPARLPTRLSDWHGDAPLMAGVSSFGFSGTNAHLVVEEAPAAVFPQGAPGRSFHVLGLSARSDGALKGAARRLAAWLSDHPDCDPADLAYTLNTGRACFEERAAWSFCSITDLIPRLMSLATGESEPPASGRNPGRPKIAFLFTGQGSQYPGMAHGLYKSQPVFRRALDDCAWRLAADLPRPLLEILFDDGAALAQTGFAQPALFAIEMALVALLRDWNIVPDIVLGHSVGEYAAACTAGVFGLEEGLRLIAGRGRLMQALPAGGAMAALSCAAERIASDIGSIPQLSLAADNDNQSVISGPIAGIEEALARLAGLGIAGQRLPVSHAFHSALLDPMLDDLERLAETIGTHPPELTLISNLTGLPVDPATRLDAAYWRRHAREPVRFGPSVKTLAEEGCDLVIEIGPNPALTPLALRAWPAGRERPRVTAVLRRGVDDSRQAADAAAAVYAAGAPIDWRAWDRPWPRQTLSLPTYPFQRRAHWIGVAVRTPDARAGASAPAPRNPILDRLRRAAPEQRLTLLADYVRRSVIESLKDPPVPLDPAAGFFDLGMDSLMAVALYDRLDTDLREACPIEPTVVFDHPTLGALTRHLTELYLGAERRSPALPAPAPTEAEGAAIAIVGIACRFPGADDPEAFWSLLTTGRDPLRRVPADRWDAEAWYDPDPDAPGRMWTREGGFLDDVAGFDAAFFGIAPREVPSMDPQHRLLLEVSWEALERAGIVPASLAGSRTGVFVGICGNEYAQVAQSGGAGSIDAYLGVGYAMSAAAGRLAYTFGLQGPALSIDTACSSSLVAVHQACRALRDGECDLALAAGVNLILNPLLNVSLTKARMLAPDGRCKTFSADADGYARSDGCGTVVLRRLADARRAGDTILAVIRGSAVNQDGRSGGLTVPSGPAQEMVVRTALAEAGLQPAEIGYVEAHGTGTSLGDPIEVQALANALGKGRAAGRPLRVGSVKSNIGHLEAAAGIAGLIKVVLALGHGRLPGQLHYRSPNPVVPWHRLPVSVVAEEADWADGRRIAGVSSFGFTGTNAHVVLEEAPPTAEPPGHPDAAIPWLFCLSARNQAALQVLTSRYADWLAADGGIGLADICHTAAARRTHWEERLAVIASSVGELQQLLEGRRAGKPLPGIYVGRIPTDPVPIPDNIASLPIEDRAALYIRGADASACAQASGGRLVPLPTYAFQHQRYWIDGNAFPLTPVPLMEAQEESRLELPTGQTILRLVLDPARQKWLGDHQIDGHVIVPGAWVATAAIAAFGAVGVVSDLILRQPVVLHEATGMQLVLFPPGEDGRRDFEVFSEGVAAAQRWTLHASGRIGPPAARGEHQASTLPPVLSAVRATEFYADCAARGLDYGPAFRAIRGLHIGDNQATAELRMVEGAGAEPRHAMHPAFLDACLQVAACAAGPASRPLLPVAIERLEVPAVAPPHLICRATLRSGVEEASLVADLWLCALDGREIGRIAGLACRPLALDDRPTARVVDWLYQPIWRESPLMSRGLPSLAELRPAADTRPPEPSFTAEGLIGRLEARALGHVIGALAALGWRPHVRERFGELALAETLGVARQFRRLWHRLLTILARAGFVKSDGNDWVVLRAIAPVPTEPVAPEEPIEMVLLDRCGRALAAVLHGKTEPLALLFPHDGSPGAEALYRNSATVEAAHGAAADLLVTAAAALAQDRPLRVLEIGAGTGGATGEILRRLGERPVRYAFTDLSGSFLSEAEARFGGSSFIEYRVLDIERDPSDQGFVLGDWDVVVAANALHAVRDLPRAIAHARSLLMPRGLLILVEGVVPRAWLDLTFGLLPGWWQFSDAVRCDDPLLSEGEWREALATAGFSETDTILSAGPWRDQAVIAAQAPAASRNWLIFADDGGVGTALMHRLAAAGDRCTLVRRDAAVAEAVRDARAGGVQGAIFLWGLDAPPEVTVETFDNTLRDTVTGVLQLVKTLVEAGTNLEGGLWVVTRGVQPESADDASALLQAPLWGLTKVAGIEHPELRCRLVDFAPQPDGDETERLAAELAAGGPEGAVVFRGVNRLVARLDRVADTEPDGEIPVRSDATYLITGGLGALGQETARWLVRRGARHVALCGRHAANDDARAACDALRREGAEVRLYTADVASAADIARMLEQIAAEMPPLRGVFHSAGVLDDGAVINQNWERFERVLGPKAGGAWALHRLTRDLPLDLFVTYSSTASLLGSPGQSNHAAANSFLDALAHFRRRLGLPATSINWSAWSELGSAARPDVARRLAAQGIDMIPPKEGIAALEAILQRGLCQVAVMPMRPKNIARREPVEGSGKMRRRLDAASPGTRKTLLIEELQRIVAKALHVRAPEELDPRVGFFELGLDSLMALEIRSRIQERLGLSQPLAVTALFDHPNIDRLAVFLLRMGWDDEAQEALSPDAVAAPDPLIEEIAGLSNAELEAIIGEEWRALSPDAEGTGPQAGERAY